MIQNGHAGKQAEADVALQTGGFDRPYANGLALALAAKGVRLEVIGSEIVDSPEMHTTPGLKFLNLWPPCPTKSTAVNRLLRVLKHYVRLIRYTAVAKPKIFHVLWNTKIQLFDRTLLMLYYKAMGKKVALTAHNVNQARRDGDDSFLNRLTLRIQYRLTDHIFVHTRKMKDELTAVFGVPDRKITVNPHPINDIFPDTDLTPAEAKRRLGLGRSEKVVLCFGRFKPYKGVEHLLEAFPILAKKDPHYRLILAGAVEKKNEDYMNQIRGMISELECRDQIIVKAEFIPDEETEVYLKAADVMALSYNVIFQSGVLFLAYTFGLPVVATDVGSFREDILEGRTGFVCRAGDPADLARAIDAYFRSDLYRNLDKTRLVIKDHADTHHSWAGFAELTRSVYDELQRSTE